MRETHDGDHAEEAARQARAEESRRGHDGVGDFVEDDEARSSAVAEEPRSPAPSGDREGDVIGQDQRTSAPIDEGPPPTSGPTSPGDFIEDDAIAAPERAAPVDTNGWRPEQRDLDFLGQRQEQLDWLAERKALMGMTPDEYQEFRSSLLEALERDGVSLDGVDIRAHGSAANYYSSDKKPFDLEEIENKGASQRLEEWLGKDRNYPAHHMFDSRYQLGLGERSDYDINISSDDMVDRARAKWEENTEPDKGDLLQGHGYVNKRFAREAFPALTEWKELWADRLGRDVSPGVFESRGPQDTSQTDANGVSVHFQDTDWIVHREG